MTKESQLDLDWWHSLTGKEMASYLKKHPHSKYANHIHLSDGAEPPFDYSKYPGKLKDLRLVSFPFSKYADDDLDKRWKYHRDAGHKSEEVVVPAEKIVATQPAIDVHWDPKTSKERNKYKPITGFMNKKGYVHLYDGHHRAEYLKSTGKPLKILVYHHTAEDEKNIAKDPRYRD